MSCFNQVFKYARLKKRIYQSSMLTFFLTQVNFFYFLFAKTCIQVVQGSGGCGSKEVQVKIAFRELG